jgi:16S rRNA processing protein RimM
MRRDLIAVGIFGAPHGVKGEVRVKSYTAHPTALAGYGALTDAGGARHYAIAALRPLKDEMVVVRIEGIGDRDAAAGLTGVELFARRENLPPTEAEEFYHADLIGLTATTIEGEAIGRVVALRNFGAGDILEIAPEDRGETLMYPFTKAVAPAIDLAAGRIVIVPPREIDGDAPEGDA